MATINPSLFSMIGQGFKDDAYVVDGNHLRWQFDTRLGFPRFAFCVDIRPSVIGRSGGNLPRFAEDLRLPNGGPVTQPFIVRPDLLVRRPGSSLQQSVGGVGLDANPLVLSFSGTDAYACWVRMRLLLRSPGGAVTAEGQYLNRGEPETVAIASRRLFRRPGRLDDAIDPGDLADRFARLIETPEFGTLPPRLLDPALRRLHSRLQVLQPGRFGRVTPGWLQRLRTLLDELGVRPDELAADLSLPVPVDLVLLAPRMDRVSITGTLAQLQSVTWIRGEHLMSEGGWKPFACFPAATSEADYVDRNADLFVGTSAEQIAKERVIGDAGKGAEPLDEPEVPPTRPPTDEELASRYLDPWNERLQPWLSQVLSDSLGGGIHQSEIEVGGDLTDAGQAPGAGVPAQLQDRDHRLSVSSYKLLLAVSANPVMSRLLGLGCIHRDPGEEVLDYRVRGRWLKADLLAWVGAAQRSVQKRIAEYQSASPFEQIELHAELLAALAELSETTSTVTELVNNAGTDPIELFAVALGVVPAQRPLYTRPGSLAVSFDGRGVPPDHGQEGVSEVRWSLRRRSRPADALSVPVGACIARAKAPSSGRFDTVRNSPDPQSNPPVPAAILPAGPVGEPGAPGEATYFDRYVDEGVDYRYGVSESDPFGRWSPFTEAAFRWDDLTPPPAPAQVTAELDDPGAPPVMALTVRFSWPEQLHPLAGFRFEIHLRRIAPPSATPFDRANWGLLERQAGSGSGPFEFDASFTGGATHDGMSVDVSQATELREDAGNGTQQQHRIYTVTFRGIVVVHDAQDRARVWAGVGSRNARGIASTGLGGPGMAEHFIVLPPPPPVFPPEPLLATYADAEGRSSFTLEWSASGGRRYTPYRAGELELVEMARSRNLQLNWQAGDPAATRSAAIRAVAPQLRDAFQPLSDLLPAGSQRYTDEVGGSLTTLLFYTVVATSPAMIPAAWPNLGSGFVAVAVPKIPQPSRPVVLRGAWQLGPSAAQVELMVAEPPARSAPIVAYELYRIPESQADRASDWRRMRPVGRFEVTPDSFVSPTPQSPTAMTLTDLTAKDWTAYLYRVVGRAAGPGGGFGTRSEPSAATRVVTRSDAAPTAPVITSARLESGNLTVRWQATAPENSVSEFRFALIRSAAEPASTLATIGADGVRSATSVDEFEVSIPAADIPAPLPAIIRLGIRDPSGRTALSDPAPVTVL